MCCQPQNQYVVSPLLRHAKIWPVMAFPGDSQRFSTFIFLVLTCELNS
uniref:Uncharacterized protein n=1 Tax=Anguilla anguilla TaxID=7936 RepID=A0A0E9UFW2_ANGAN